MQFGIVLTMFSIVNKLGSAELVIITKASLI